MLKVDERITDAKSILAILLLCANFGSVVILEATGADEDQALAAITSVFKSANSDSKDMIEDIGNMEDSRR